MDNVPVIGPAKDIREVQNAIKAYNLLFSLKTYSEKDFLKAHAILMENLLKTPGAYRRKQVGILKGNDVTHIAPGYSMVPG